MEWLQLFYFQFLFLLILQLRFTNLINASIIDFEKNKILYLPPQNTVVVVQLVRTSDCGSEGRGFKSHHPPKQKASDFSGAFFYTTKRCNVFPKFGPINSG